MHFGEAVMNGHAASPSVSVGSASVGGADNAPQPQPSGNLCPQCGSAAFVLEEGCKKCHACGYSEC